MQKILYIIPGFGESTKDGMYRKIIHSAKSAGYTVVSYTPKWSRRVATDWINDFKKILPLEKMEKVSVLGFSLGAYIAINTARDFSFERIIACSPSPFYKDDIRHMSREAWRFLGKRRMQDFGKYRFPKNIKSRIVFMVGEKENIPDFYMDNTDRRYKMWAGKKKKIIVKGAEHDLESGEYLQMIKKELTS